MAILQKFRESLKHNLAGTVLSAALPILAAASAQEAKATEPWEQSYGAQEATVQSAEPQYLMFAVGQTPGASGSLWGSKVTITNPSATEMSTGRVLVTLQGQDATGTENFYLFTLQPGAAVDVDLMSVLGLPGSSGTAKIITETGEAPIVTEVVDNTQQYGTDPSKKSKFFNYAKASKESEFLLPGDQGILALPKAPFYLNLGLLGLREEGDTENPVVRIKGVDYGGIERCLFDVALSNGGPIQLVRATEQNCPAGAADYLQGGQLIVMPIRGKALTQGSVIYANPDLFGANDSAIQTMTTRRLLEEFRATLTPEAAAEVNDELILNAYARTRPGAKVVGMSASYQPNENWTHGARGDGRDLRVSARLTYAEPADLVARAVLTAVDETGNAYIRHVTGNTVPITAEQDGYVATKEDAKAFILGNLTTVSTWSSHGMAGGMPTRPTDWQAAWPLYFDGINAPPNNPELETLVFRDAGNEVTGNIMQIKGLGGYILGVGGMPEREFDSFRQGSKAKLPQ
jgi:hypothetical protein